MRRVGCLAVVAVCAVGAWLSRDLWWERITGRAAPGAVQTWTPVEPPAQAPAVRRRVEALEKGQGQVFASLTPAEVGALVMNGAGGRMPPTVRDVETAVVGDAISVRASVDLSALRAVEGLGPLAALLTSRQRITLSGRPRVVEPGRGVFDVDAVKVGGVEVPGPALSALIAQLDRGGEGAPRAVPGSGDTGRGISFSLPRYVGDIRVAGGRVILYKTSP